MQDFKPLTQFEDSRGILFPHQPCVLRITFTHLPPGRSAKLYLAVQRSCKHYKTLQAVCLRRIKSESLNYFVTIATGQGANNSKFELTLRVHFCSFRLTLKSPLSLPPFSSIWLEVCVVPVKCRHVRHMFDYCWGQRKDEPSCRETDEPCTTSKIFYSLFNESGECRPFSSFTFWESWHSSSQKPILMWSQRKGILEVLECSKFNINIASDWLSN